MRHRPRRRVEPRIAAPRRVAERTTIGLVLLATLVQGLIYLLLLPPWQHYDEPTHFEYAWLVAHLHRQPTPQDIDPTFRRTVAASMIEHNFYHNLAQPDLWGAGADISIGVSELHHPPLYYALVSVPLRFVAYLDITDQLYVARSVSLLLFVLTIGAALGLMRELTPPQHPLRWAVPLALALVPTFADLMTAVNNDVGAIWATTLFGWGAARTVQRGLSWRRLIWLVGSAALAFAMKRTGMIVAVLLPLVVLVALWRSRHWRWRWLLAGVAAAALLAATLVLRLDRPAGWYCLVASDDCVARVAVADGTHALTLRTAPRKPAIITPIDEPLTLRDQNVTVGGWMWADRAATVLAPGLVYSRAGLNYLETLTQPISVSTTPQFVTWTTTVPSTTVTLYYTLFGAAVAGEAPTQVYLRGPLLLLGNHSASVDPSISSDSAVNLVHDPAFEHRWPRWIDTFEQPIASAVDFSPTIITQSLLDTRHQWPRLLSQIVPSLSRGVIQQFAWGHVGVAWPGWGWMFGVLLLAALVGVANWLWRPQARRLLPLLLILAILLVATVLLVLGRALPLLTARVYIPSARYGFPALLPLVLLVVGGWWVLWPSRWRWRALLALLSFMLLYNGVALWSIWSYYQAVALAA